MSTSKSTDSDSMTSDESTLAKKLHSALEFTCKKYMASLKFSLLKSKYKEIYKHNPEALKSNYDQLCSQLSATIAEELDDLCQQQGIEYLLDSLDMIKKSQDPSQVSWRPSGNPEEDLRDHFYLLKLKQKEDLQGILRDLSNGNTELKSDLAVNHGEIMTLKKENEDMYEKFSNIISSFAGSKPSSVEGTIGPTIEEC